MTVGRLVFSRRALADVERFIDFLAEAGDDQAAAVARLIRGALAPLAEHPYMGRPVEHGLREAVISRGRTGYVALYRFDEARGAVLVLALRHQREAGYTPEPSQPRPRRPRR